MKSSYITDLKTNPMLFHEDVEYIRKHGRLMVPEASTDEIFSKHGYEFSKVLYAIKYVYYNKTGITLNIKLEQKTIPGRKSSFDMAIYHKGELLYLWDVDTYHTASNAPVDRIKDEETHKFYPESKIFRLVNKYPEEISEYTKYVQVAKATKISTNGCKHIASFMANEFNKVFTDNFQDPDRFAEDTISIMEHDYFKENFLPDEGIMYYDEKNNPERILKMATEIIERENYINKETAINSLKIALCEAEMRNETQGSIKNLTEEFNTYDFYSNENPDPCIASLTRAAKNNDIIKQFLKMYHNNTSLYHPDAIFMITMGISRRNVKKIKEHLINNPDDFSKIVSTEDISLTEKKLKDIAKFFRNFSEGYKFCSNVEFIPVFSYCMEISDSLKISNEVYKSDDFRGMLNNIKKALEFCSSKRNPELIKKGIQEMRSRNYVNLSDLLIS